MRNGKPGKRPSRVTANDVAKLAGVSQMTVSRVINNDPRVREKTRAKVESSIAQLGYEPNKAARSLVSANPIQIGLLYSHPNSTFLSKMMMGVLDWARQSDTHVVIVTCEEGPEAVVTVNGLIEDGIDGIVLAPPLCDSRPLFDILIENQIPAVTVGSRHQQEKISAVFIDDRRAAILITQHLLSLGHRRIGFIIGDADQTASRLRLSGYTEAIEQAGIQIDDSLIVQGEFSFRSGFEAANQLLQNEQPPTAILASNDDMAAGVISAARQYGFRIPETLSVCGFDNSLMASQFWPPITTVHQPIDRMTQVAIEHLENNIRLARSGMEPRPQSIELEFSLVRRDSDAAIPAPDQDAASVEPIDSDRDSRAASTRKSTMA